MKGLAPWLQLIGLVAGFLAALFITIAQIPGGGIAEGYAGGREDEYLVLHRPRLWHWGVGLLLIAFGFQLLGTILQLLA